MRQIRIAYATGNPNHLLNVCAGNMTPAVDAVKPITKGTFWEIVAVPDIRIACAALAEKLI